jgi:serine/threonine protein kinase
MSLSAGTRLGRYEIFAPIGPAGMRQVYKARDTRQGRIVAVKVSDEKFSERFEREARGGRAESSQHLPALRRCMLHPISLVHWRASAKTTASLLSAPLASFRCCFAETHVLRFDEYMLVNNQSVGNR